MNAFEGLLDDSKELIPSERLVKALKFLYENQSESDGDISLPAMMMAFTEFGDDTLSQQSSVVQYDTISTVKPRIRKPKKPRPRKKNKKKNKKRKH